MDWNVQAFIFLLISVFLLKDAHTQSTKNFTLGADLIQAVQIVEKDDNTQCYVDVVVHNSSSFKFGMKNALVTALSGHLKEHPKYSQGNTNADGKVCLTVECGRDVRLFVEKQPARIPVLNETMQQRSIPAGYQVQFELGNEVIKFQAYVWGNIQGKTGPVYDVHEKDKCRNAGLNNYYFVFYFVAISGQLFATPVPMAGLSPFDPGFQYMWRYGIPGSYSMEPKTCYVKIKIKVESSDVHVTASSYEGDTTGQLLGTFTTRPQFNPSSSNINEKVACVEYRCPIIDILNETLYDTYIKGSIDVPGRNSGCCVRNDGRIRPLFKANATSFWTDTPMSQDLIYGPRDGIYMHSIPQIARTRCFTGQDFVDLEYEINVNTGYAFVYDCTAACVNTWPSVIG